MHAGRLDDVDPGGGDPFGRSGRRRRPAVGAGSPGRAPPSSPCAIMSRSCAGQSAVGRKPSVAMRAGLAPSGQLGVVHPDEAADVRRGRPSWRSSRSRRRARTPPRATCARACGRGSRLAPGDQPGVLGEPGGVQEQRHAVRAAQRARPLQVRHRTGCPPPPLLVMVMTTWPTRAASGPVSVASSASRSMFPLNGSGLSGPRPPGRAGRAASAPVQFHVGARGVEVGVAQDDRARLRAGDEKSTRSAARPWWAGRMCGYAGQVGDQRSSEPVERVASPA